MYYEIKDQLYHTFINLDKIDRIMYRCNDNKITVIINGHTTSILCDDEFQAKDVFNEITEEIRKEKGVVSRQHNEIAQHN